MRGLKRGAIVLGIILIAFFSIVYAARGIGFSLTQRDFCASVNRFVVTERGDDIVSLVENGTAAGYHIRNVILPPFYWSGGAERRRARLIVGQSYQFKTVGIRTRFPRNLPIIIHEDPVAECSAT